MEQNCLGEFQKFQLGSGEQEGKDRGPAQRDERRTVTPNGVEEEQGAEAEGPGKATTHNKLWRTRR